jgi:hypothetical protein
MSANKLTGMLCTSINDVNEMSEMLADKLVSGQKTSPTCRVGVHLSLCKHGTKQIRFQ